MLDALKKLGAGGTRRSAKATAEDLETLVAMAREEGGALSSMLKRVESQTARLAQFDKTLEDVGGKATGAVSRLDEITARIGKIEQQTQKFEQIEVRTRALLDAVGEAEGAAQKLLAPDGDLQKHRHAVQQLSTQALQTTASLETLRKEQAVLDELRDELRRAQAQVKGSSDRTEGLRADLDQLRGVAHQLAQDYAKLRESVRETRENTDASGEAVKEIEKRLGSLATLQELSKTTEERVSALNTLAEHVSQKLKVLENQKHTVEHAVVESNRLNELVWNMDVQISRLNEGSRQMARTEEAIERIDKTARETSAQLEAALKTKEAFAQDVGRLERERGQLVEFVRNYLDRLSTERKEFDAFDQRARALQVSLGEIEKSVDGLAARERNVAALNQKIEGLEKQIGTMIGQADELQRKQASLETLQERLGQVDELSRRTAWQMDALKQSRQELETLRKEIQEFYKSHAAAVQLRDALAADRASLETFIERMEGFTRQVPELESKLDTITGKLSIVDEGAQKAANLVAITDDLDRQMTRIAGQSQFVERVEGRVNALNTLSADVDRKLQEQLSRRSEVEGLKSLCDGLGLQVTDAQQKLEAVGALQNKLLPLTAQLAMLKGQLEKAHTRFKEVQLDQAQIADQEKRLAELLSATRGVASEAAGRLKQVEGLSIELARSSAQKDELLEELGRVQGRQRDVAAHTEATEEQIRRVDAVLKQVEQRRSQLAFAERKIAAFEGRLDDLRLLAEDVERKIQAIAAREATVEAIKNEVAAVHEISARSKADLQHVADHRSDVAAIKEAVDEVLGRMDETEERLGIVEARKKLVDEVQLKTATILNVLEDVRVNLEMVTEQKAVVDHAVEQLARLDGMVRGAQATLKGLQAERELAERIERSIKQLKSQARPVEEARRRA